jgi:benzoate-CoA ligase family protein
MVPEALNIADYFLVDRVREGRGDRVALRLAGRTVTYEGLDRLACWFGNALRSLGVRQEERVIIGLPDGAEFAGALFGTLKIGAVAVMVNADQPAEAIAAIVGYSRARVAVVSSAGAPAFAGLQLLVCDDVQVGREPPGDCVLDPVRTHRDDPAIWLFSGGTTGRPKAVVQTHRSFVNSTERYAKAFLGYREDDVTLAVPKLYFGYATGSNLFFPLAVGGSAALFPEPPTADELFAQIRLHRPTILITSPRSIKDLVDHPSAAEQDLSCLRFATSAGEALPVALYQRWKGTFAVELLDGLGTAEMWHVFVSNHPADVCPGTLGKEVPGFEVRIRDLDGRDLPDGEVGRLWVRGDSRAIGYWQDMDRTREAFRGEWFVGGDLARRDPDGTITYVGRADDALKVSGRWLLPADVEGCLLEHPAVREAAVVGVLDANGLTKPVEFVVAAPQPGLEDALRRHCLERLDAYKHPRRVFLVDALPRTHLGKINRGELRSRAEL